MPVVSGAPESWLPEFPAIDRLNCFNMHVIGADIVLDR